MAKLKWILDKAAVENEPGLTNAQMMLTNSDLRPGEFVQAYALVFSLMLSLQCATEGHETNQ
jgi:hypothetical protein